MRRLLLIFVLVSSPVWAQMPMPSGSVLADRVTIGPEFIPRCQNLPSMLIVPAGQTVTLADGAVLDCIEVAGTLTLSRAHDTTAKVTTLLVLPTGKLDFGSPASPVPPTIHATLTIRNVPINTTLDPFQWGNGVANFGTWTINGPKRAQGLVLAVDPKKGDTTLTLASAPTGWQAGDELIIPDTKTHWQPNKPDVEAHQSVASIAGMVVTLSKPLDYDHLTVKGLDGRIVAHPEVMNLTRNIVIQSENPAGTPGHLANITATACWDVEGVELVGLGRTRAEPIDRTTSDLSHIGTNQIAKYAFHEHMVTGTCAFPRQTIDMVLVSKGLGKWGHVTHGTHDTLVQDSLAVGFPGAGFVTEDGNEVRNVFRHDLAVNNIQPITDGSRNDAGTNFGQTCFGCEGTGFWFHGVQNSFDRLEAWGNTVGINLFDSFISPLMYPSVPGGTPDTLLQQPYTNDNPFILFDHFLGVGQNLIGVEVWGLKRAPADNVLLADNYIGVMLKQSDAVQGWFRHATIVSDYWKGNGTPEDLTSLYYSGACVRLATGYVDTFEMSDSYLSGCPIGVMGTSAHVFPFTDTTIQGALGIFFNQGVPDQTVLTRVTFLPYGQQPPRFLLNETGMVIWNGTGPYPPPINGSVIPPQPQPDPTPMWMPVTGKFLFMKSDTTTIKVCDDAGQLHCTLYVPQ